MGAFSSHTLHMFTIHLPSLIDLPDTIMHPLHLEDIHLFWPTYYGNARNISSLNHEAMQVHPNGAITQAWHMLEVHVGLVVP